MMSCCKCDAPRERWLDFCAICGLTQCAKCEAAGCCGFVPMKSGSFDDDDEEKPAPGAQD